MTAGHEPPQPTREVAVDLKDIERDLEFERAVLDESIKHDYSTSEVGVVPLDRRRPSGTSPDSG
jgi:hypothetical protein